MLSISEVVCVCAMSDRTRTCTRSHAYLPLALPDMWWTLAYCNTWQPREERLFVRYSRVLRDLGGWSTYVTVLRVEGEKDQRTARGGGPRILSCFVFWEESVRRFPLSCARNKHDLTSLDTLL